MKKYDRNHIFYKFINIPLNKEVFQRFLFF
jgi:hypothetical protein